MLTIIHSVYFEHDLTLLLVAAVLCILGSGATFAMWSYIRSLAGLRRLYWVSVAALTAASAIWGTHFTGTLAYSYDVGRGLSFGWTVASMIVAIVLSFLATVAITRDRSDVASGIVSAAALTATVAGMHYSGVMAYSESALIFWRYEVVAASLAVAFACNLAAAMTFQRGGRAARYAVPGALALGVLTLHLFGMSGMMLEPCFPNLPFTVGVPPWLTLAVIGTVAIVISGAGAAMVFDRTRLHRRSLEADRLAALADTLAEARDAAEQASRVKSRFLAHMSHEIRTPLNGILGMAEVLSLSALDAEQRDCVSTIQSSGQALLRIVNEVLDLARIEADRVELASAPFDLLGELEDVVTLLTRTAEAKGLRLHLRYRPDVPRQVRGDAGRVRQIALNLVGNALKFTEAGHVLVDVARNKAGDGVVLRVVDTGIGIPAEKIGHVFESYGQAHSEFGGTGLGLAISRSLARLMGGDITVSAGEAAGSTFCAVLALPALAEPAAATGALGRFAVICGDPLEREILTETAVALGAEVTTFASAAEFGDHETDSYAGAVLSGADDAEAVPAALPALVVGDLTDVHQRPCAPVRMRLSRPVRRDRLAAWLTHPESRTSDAVPMRIGKPAAAPPCLRRRLLIVDDGVVNRKVLRKMLGTDGFTIVEASDGMEAIEATRDETFDAILMDVSMPRMDGMQATSHIRARDGREGRERPLILGVTGHALEADIARFLDSGMDDVIVKPLQRQDLLAALGIRRGVAARDVA